MYGFLLAVLVLDGIFLAVVILLQSGKGGGLAAVGGGGGTMTEGVLGGRQAATVLTRSTWTAGTVFMLLALTLSILSSRAEVATSVIEVNQPATTAPQPVLPGVGNQPVPEGNPPGADPGNDGN